MRFQLRPSYDLDRIPQPSPEGCLGQGVLPCSLFTSWSLWCLQFVGPVAITVGDIPKRVGGVFACVNCCNGRSAQKELTVSLRYLWEAARACPCYCAAAAWCFSIFNIMLGGINSLLLQVVGVCRIADKRSGIYFCWYLCCLKWVVLGFVSHDSHYHFAKKVSRKIKQRDSDKPQSDRTAAPLMSFILFLFFILSRSN